MTKRRILKSILSLVLICSLFSFNIFIVNASYNEALAAQGIEIINTKYSKTVKTEMSTKITMSESNLSSLKKDLGKKNLTKYEQNVAILKELGFSEQALNTMDDLAISSMFENALSIQTDSTYMKVGEDGTTIVVSENDYLATLEQNNSKAATNNDGWDTYTSNDGYMRMTVSSEYIDPAAMNGELGYYYIHVWYEWLTPPKEIHRKVDGLGISAPRLTWRPMTEAGAFYSSMGYVIDDDGTFVERSTTPKNLEDFNLTPSVGIYYTWELPDDEGSFFNKDEVAYIQLYVRAKGRILNPELMNDFPLYISYTHVYPEFEMETDLQLSFAWEAGTSGPEATAGAYLTFDPEITDQFRNYNFYTAVSYNPSNT